MILVTLVPSVYVQLLGYLRLPFQRTFKQLTSNCRLTKRVLLGLAAAGQLLISQAALADEDPWPCQVVLCLANPDGPTVLKECRPPIERAWRVWARGKRVPDCKKKNQDGSTGGSVREDGTYVENLPSDPNKEGQCPFVYYAGHDKQRYCAFAGVTNEYINGTLWGRIWYGGPGGVPYIETLVEDPLRPRPEDGFEEAWRLLKSEIENKADFAAIAHKIWQDADKRALAAEDKAASARSKAERARDELADLEAHAPGLLDAALQRRDAAREQHAAAKAEADAARIAADAPDATPALKARYDALAAKEKAADAALSAAHRAVTRARDRVASIPSMRANAAQLDAKASAAESEAVDLRSTAIVAKAEFDAAELAARPLPDVY